MFRIKEPPFTLEAAIIAVMAAALLAFLAYRRIEPIVTLVYPEFRATRDGPVTFPVRVHIGADALQVTNRSAQDWRCGLRVGPGNGIPAPVPYLPAGETRDVAFTSITGGRSQLRAATIRRLARRSIEVRCLDQNGRNHLVRLPYGLY